MDPDDYRSFRHALGAVALALGASVAVGIVIGVSLSVAFTLITGAEL